MKKLLLALTLLAPLPAFADSTIDALGSAAALAGTESVPIFQTANPALKTTTGAIGNAGALTGDVTKSAGSGATTLAAGSASNLNSGTLPAARMPALTGDCTTSAGAVATTCWHWISTYKSSNWYTAPGITTSAAASAIVASTVYCHPFVISPQGATIKSLGLVVPTPAVGNASAAVYRPDGTGGRPGTLIDSIASQSTNANPLSAAVANTTDVLTGGMYWMCTSSDNTSVRFLTVPVGAGGGYAPALIGSATLTSAMSASNNIAGISCTAASTCAGTFAVWLAGVFTWSSLASATWTEVTTGLMPQVAIQAN